MLKRSKKILLEGTLAEFKNYPRGAEGREYVLMNIEEKGPDGSYAFYEKDEKGDIIPVSYKGAEGYDATEFILFTDPEFKRIILANFNTNPKGGITTREANAITSIGQLFKGNTALVTTEDLALLKSVKTIPLTAFLGCTGLETAIIPKQITDLGNNCFDLCTNLKTLKVYGGAKIASSASFGLVGTLDFVGFYGTRTANIGTFNRGVNSNYAFINDGVLTIFGDTFYGFTNLTEISIPSSVNRIEDSAFYGCTGLTRVNITDLSAWCKIYFLSDRSNPIFYAHKLYLNGEEVEDVVIPNDIAKINDYTFKGLTSLKSIIIPNSITEIGILAFRECISLTSIIIPDSVTEIRWGAFEDCTNLTSVIIPSSVTIIGAGAFENCTHLTSLEILNGVTTIRNDAFGLCESLKQLMIPNSVTEIGGGAFLGCTDLNSITVDTGNANFDSRDNCNAIIDTATNTLIQGCKNTIIPNSVIKIGNAAFKGYTSLTSVTIPNSVTVIGMYAFEGCTSLTSVAIPNSVTSIGSYAFKDCTGLTSIEIPNSVTTIQDSTFKGCSGLASVIIPDGVKYINGPAFSDCTSLTDVTIGNKVTSMGSNTFRGCPILTVTFHCNLVSDWFLGNTTIEEIVIEDEVANIGNYAFRNCTSLSSVTIGNSVTSIGQQAFYGCTSLTSIIVKGETPATMGANIFNNVDKSSCTLYVPINSLEAYQTANYWKDFLNIVGFDPEEETQE